MSDTALLRRMRRRETQFSRAVPSIVCASILLGIVLWLGGELVLSVIGHRPVLLSPVQLAAGAVRLGQDTRPGVLPGVGIALAVLGLVLVALALVPGVRSRHVVADPRSAVVVDSEVLAAALSRTARQAAHLAAEQVLTRVGPGTVDVFVHPTSGVPVDRSAIEAAVERELAGYDLLRPLALRVQISDRGALGV